MIGSESSEELEVPAPAELEEPPVPELEMPAELEVPASEELEVPVELEVPAELETPALDEPALLLEGRVPPKHLTVPIVSVLPTAAVPPSITQDI